MPWYSTLNYTNLYWSGCWQFSTKFEINKGTLLLWYRIMTNIKMTSVITEAWVSEYGFKSKWPPFCRLCFQMHLVQWNFLFKFHQTLYLGVDWQQVVSALGNGLAPNMKIYVYIPMYMWLHVAIKFITHNNNNIHSIWVHLKGSFLMLSIRFPKGPSRHHVRCRLVCFELQLNIIIELAWHSFKRNIFTFGDDQLIWRILVSLSIQLIWGLDKMYAILQTTCSNTFRWMTSFASWSRFAANLSIVGPFWHWC